MHISGYWNWREMGADDHSGITYPSGNVPICLWLVREAERWGYSEGWGQDHHIFPGSPFHPTLHCTTQAQYLHSEQWRPGPVDAGGQHHLSQDTPQLPSQRWHEAAHWIHVVHLETVRGVVHVPGGWTEEGKGSCTCWNNGGTIVGIYVLGDCHSLEHTCKYWQLRTYMCWYL